MKHKQTGLTLIEIMVTLGVAGIVLSFGVPKFQLMMQNNRITTNTNALIGSLNLARSEAIKRGARITIRKTGSGGWEDGWEIVDTNTSEVIRTINAPTGTLDIASTTSESEFVYLANGFFQPGTEKTMYVCDSVRSGEIGRTIEISIAGKAKVANKKYTCDPAP